MKLPNPEQFNFKDCVIAGDECWLITPRDMATDWTDENARFRSCIVRQSDNFVVSQGFLKFCNFGEKPLFQPWDDSWKFDARHKLDGSLLIVSKYKGELIIRTRGTTDARQMANGHEIDLLIKKYFKFFDTLLNSNDHSSSDRSFLFEWTTSTNIIVLREHDEPTLTLIGVVEHIDCRYSSQILLDNIARTYGLTRPQKYEYDSISDCIADVSAWSGKEGVVLYSPDGQTLKKIKADEYCELHKLATGIKGINQVLDVFMASPKFTEYQDFYDYIEKTLDFEIAEKCSVFIKTITDAYAQITMNLEGVKDLVTNVTSRLESRKEQALDIQERFEQIYWASAFKFLDGKDVDDNLLKKLMDNHLE